ncbi:MAG TPA: peptidoglycan DD-metalloendopeptidase family protein [Longimicrobiales bacterium]
MKSMRVCGGVQVGVVLLLLLPAAPLLAQQNTELRESQQRLEKIRQERQELQRELEQLRTRVRDASRESQNLARQRAASESALRELDYQADVINAGVDSITRELDLTHIRLRQRTAALHERLRSIYKRGKLHTVRVLFSAESFGDVLRRYKYLHLITLNDRLIVTDVKRLEARQQLQEQELRRNLTQLDNLRLEKNEELRQLERLYGRQSRELRQFREQEKATSGRIAQLAKDEARLANVIADLERRRLAGNNASRTGTISTRDLGNLTWPVDGNLVFRFGPQRRPNGVVLRYNGIGIAAPVGTPVKAVETGTVEVAGVLEGYGQSIVIGHGAGYYTLYLRLRSLAVGVGQRVTAGQVVGTVGGEGSPEGAHLEFQVRTPGIGGAPAPVDPLNWLRARAGAQ